MSRPIDGDAFSDWLKEYGQEYIHGKKKISLMYIWKHVQDMPTITPERKRGRWIKYEDRAGWYCSECATGDYYAYFRNSDTGEYELQDKFCPNCGAKMTEEELCK